MQSNALLVIKTIPTYLGHFTFDVSSKSAYVPSTVGLRTRMELATRPTHVTYSQSLEQVTHWKSRLSGYLVVSVEEG